MSRKPVLEGGRRDQMTAAAQELFLSQGYDATTVRAITRRVGCEVGLFYYYFKDKSDVFDRVMAGLLAPLEDGLGQAVSGVERNPCRGLQLVYAAFAKGSAELQSKLGDQTHWTVQKALEGRMLEALENAIRQTVALLTRLGAKFVPEPEMTVELLSHGLGHLLLADPRADLRKGICLVQGIDEETGGLRVPVPAEERDLAGWMELADRTERFSTPGARSELEQAIREQIRRKSAYVVRWRGQIVGAVLLSKGEGSLSHLAVHPGFQRRDLTQRLLETALAAFPVGRQVTLTVEDGDLAAACVRYGFREESAPRSRTHRLTFQTDSAWPGGYRL